jgi:quercetin dioxygenase-like cupin family protein
LHQELTIMASHRSLRWAAPAALALLISAALGADPPPASSSASILMTRDLAGVPGKEVILLTVEYVPGGASMPHRHDANTFVYVLEGSFTTQVDGGEKVTLGPGQTFYESPTDVHRVSANGSATQPAKILVFMVKDKGKPASRAVTTPAPR